LALTYEGVVKIDMRKGIVAIPISFLFIMAMAGLTYTPHGLMSIICNIYIGYTVLYIIYLIIQYKYSSQYNQNKK
jgi:hypothetical protein